MLELKNITKTYKTNKGIETQALKNVSLTFPDKGLVFILGKSGSGKSTLLNIAGGLDVADSGELIIDGKSGENFSQSDYDSYRNTYVGFIFQDFNLMESYTIEKNIALALQLQQRPTDTHEIEDILEKVDLKGYGSRYPNELSGGQKQRVAIARALVKHPHILMADEPTGALDSDTGASIFGILKELAKERLVIVVSHDRDAAQKYADRTIEFKDGEILSDTNTSVEVVKSEHEFHTITSHLPFKNSFFLGLSCLTHKKIRMVFTILLTSFALVSFAIADTVADFNEVNAHAKGLVNEKESLVGVRKQIVTKDGIRTGTYSSITDEDFAKIKADTPNSKFIPSYKTAMQYMPETIGIATNSENGSRISYFGNLYSIRLMEMNDFRDLGYQDVIGTFPKDYTEVAITSYIADYIIEFGVEVNDKLERASSYEEIISKKMKLEIEGIPVTISGIVKFDLKEFDPLKKLTFENLESSDYTKLNKLSNLAKIKLGNVYLKEGFTKQLKVVENTMADQNLAMFFYNTNGVDIYTEPSYLNQEITIFDGEKEKRISTLNEGEIILSFEEILNSGFYEKLDKLNGKSGSTAEEKLKAYKEYSSRIINKTSKFGIYESTMNFNIDEPTKEYDAKLIGVTVPSADELSQLRSFDENRKTYVAKSWIETYIRPAIYIDGVYTNLATEAEFKDFFQQYGAHDEFTSDSLVADTVSSILRIADVASQIFYYVSLAFFIFAALLMMNFIVVSITYRKKDIGILRAIGARSSDVLKIFIWEGICLAAISFIVSLIGTYGVATFVNSISAKSFGVAIPPIIITLRQPILLIIVLCIVTALACAYPVLKISRQKPIDAIKK